MPIVDPIRVDGLTDLQTAAAKAEGDAARYLHAALEEIADLVATGARRGVPRKTGRAASSIRATGTTFTAGGSRAPYYPWLDWGGKVGRKRSISRPWRPDGRYLFPTYRNSRQAILRTVDGALAKLYDDSGLD